MKKKKQALKFNFHVEEKNLLPLDTGIHAKTMVQEEIRMALDNALPQTFRTMVEYEKEGSLFLGYPFLQVLAQNPLISAGVETIADEMTKKFAKIIYTGDSLNNNLITTGDKIKYLESELRKYKIRSLFRIAAEKIGYYGGCLVYIDTGVKDPEILKSPLILDPATFRQNSLRRFTLIDPINIMPGLYNSVDPTASDYFKPSTWFVLGKEIHASRFLYFAGKEAPLLYKPSYNFFGISQAQLAFEYVENFQKNRDSGSELLNKFSISILKTNMMGALAGSGTSELDSRIQYFIQKRHNDGVFVLDKDEEDFIKSDTSLTGITDIVRQSLELIASVFRIPAVKYLGISPSGFNATGESDLKNFYSLVESLQEKQFADNLENILKILQLNMYGNIDPHITYEFIPLDEEDNKIKADTEKVKADTLAIYLDRNVISAEESRTIIAEDKEGLMKTIDPDNTKFLDNIEEQIEQEDNLQFFSNNI